LCEVVQICGVCDDGIPDAKINVVIHVIERPCQ
jgi:hypothetical protein